MDYAFAPGTTEYDALMRDLFRHRANTALIHTSAVSRVDLFIKHLETDAGVTRPVEDIIIASHANDQGWMEIQFGDIDADGNGSPDVNTTYEVLEIADNDGVADIPATVRQATSTFHVKGCKIGQAFAQPFVQKLRDALGGVVPVTAPKHFHEVWERTDLGIVEYLGYDFSVANKTAFPNRNAVIAAFQGAGLRFIDGSVIPNAKWTTWLPANVSHGRRKARPFTVKLNPSLTPNSGSAISSLRLSGDTDFRHDIESHSFTVNYGTGSPPSAKAAQFADMKTSMAGVNIYTSAHPYPMFQRYEFNNLNDFIDGFEWNCTPDGHLLRCVGSRRKYTLIMPITDPANDNMFFNFYPYTTNTTPAHTGLPTTDPRFFLTL